MSLGSVGGEMNGNWQPLLSDRNQRMNSSSGAVPLMQWDSVLIRALKREESRHPPTQKKNLLVAVTLNLFTEVPGACLAFELTG